MSVVPLVLVHGLAGSSGWWRHVVDAIEPARKTLVVDLPGFGTRRRDRFVLADAPDRLAAMVAEEGAPADVIGHSLGGLVCARLAARHPELVRRLVLVAPAGVPARSSVLSYALPLAQTLGRAGPRLLRLVAADAVRAGPRTLARAARDLLADEVRGDIERIAAPTLLVWGEHDSLVPPSLGEAFRERIPNARLVVLSGAGHAPMVERPNAFAASVLEFLDGR